MKAATLRSYLVSIAFVFLAIITFTMETYAAILPVKVTNIPLQVQDAPSAPFQVGMFNVEFATDQLGAQTSFTVPAGKLLVIEFVSAAVGIDQGSVPIFSVTTTVNGVPVSHQLLTNPVGPGGGYAQTYSVSQNMRLYAAPGTEVILYAGRTLGGRGAMHVSLSGYLVPAP